MKKKAPLVIIFITIFLDLVGFGMVIPVLPFYAEHFGASALHIGMLAASFSLMQFIFAPIWGRLSDRVGRRPIILMSLVGSTGSLLLFGLASSLAFLFVARILAGIFMANISAAQAYIADVTPPEQRAKGMGLMGAAFGLGFIFGPAIGGVLSNTAVLENINQLYATLSGTPVMQVIEADKYRIPFFFAAFLSLLNTLSAWMYLPESRTREELEKARTSPAGSQSRFARIKAALSKPGVGGLILLFFVITVAFANLEATFALMTERNLHFDATENGYLFVFIGLIAAVVQGTLIGPLTRKFGESRLLVTGLAMQGSGFFFLPYMMSLPDLLPFLAIVSVGNALSSPCLHSLISKNTDRDEQGGVLGITQSMGSLARVVGPVWGGWFFDLFGVPAPYWSGGILLLICASFAFTLTASLRASLRPE